MGTLILVRHGQASFGAADYDQLSPLGDRQCEALGAHWRGRGIRFDAVLIGSLRRHRQSLDAIVRGHRMATEHAETDVGQQAEEPAYAWPEPLVWHGLNEYDPEALVGALHPEPLPLSPGPESRRRHFRLLREALLAWMDGRTQPAGMPSHADFMHGVTSALDHLREHCVGQQVLVVSSGGPISHAVGHVLRAPPETIVELNLRIRNSAVTEFVFSARRHSMLTFNTLPHLDSAERGDWVTFA
jgi:broad specificity phosphatase PhoE